jgi:hypothetical protein
LNSDLNFIGFLLILFVVGLYSIYSGLKNYRFVNKIKNTAVSSIASAAIGLVELSGRASSDTPEPGPISGNPCVYWRITGEYFHSGKSGHWVRIYTATSAKRFYIRDNTGRMHVDPEGGLLDIPAEKFKGYIAVHGLLSNEPADMDERVMNYIRSLPGKDAAEFMRYKEAPIRVTEYYIADNDPLYIMGSAEPLKDASGAGQDEILEIRKGDTDKTLYISTTGERQVIQEFSSWIHLKIFGGLALCAAVLFCILSLSELEANEFVYLIITMVIGCAVLYAIYKMRRH